ncbi:hypothetical protein BC940DRAFT_366198 [Gongronella butleri]|nr:hypothetical protein BC940DRAFT_366198 [Gongronella butleri]
MDPADTVQQQLDTLVKDPILSDISLSTSLHELDLLIALERHQAFKIHITRETLPTIDIIVRQADSVKDIRKAFEQAWRLAHPKESVNWRYIWKNYCLMFGQQRLSDDEALVSQVGLRHGSRLCFSRKR